MNSETFFTDEYAVYLLLSIKYVNSSQVDSFVNGDLTNVCFCFEMIMMEFLLQLT